MNSGTVGMTQGSSMMGTQKPANANNANVQDLSSIIRSVRADISHIKTQMEQLPAFPEGNIVVEQGVL